MQITLGNVTMASWLRECIVTQHFNCCVSTVARMSVILLVGAADFNFGRLRTVSLSFIHILERPKLGKILLSTRYSSRYPHFLLRQQERQKLWKYGGCLRMAYAADFQEQLMQKHPQLTFIVRSPNGNIQLATQPAVKDIKLIKCHNCSKVHTVKDMAKIKCSECDQIISASRCDEPGCKGEIRFVYLVGPLIVRECSQCKKIIPVG